MWVNERLFTDCLRLCLCSQLHGISRLELALYIASVLINLGKRVDIVDYANLAKVRVREIEIKRLEKFVDKILGSANQKTFRGIIHSFIMSEGLTPNVLLAYILTIIRSYPGIFMEGLFAVLKENLPFHTLSMKTIYQKVQRLKQMGFVKRVKGGRLYYNYGTCRMLLYMVETYKGRLGKQNLLMSSYYSLSMFGLCRKLPNYFEHIDYDPLSKLYLDRNDITNYILIDKYPRTTYIFISYFQRRLHTLIKKSPYLNEAILRRLIMKTVKQITWRLSEEEMKYIRRIIKTIIGTSSIKELLH